MGCQIAIRFPGENEISLVNTRGREKCWEFDCVFDPNKNQEDIFREVQVLFRWFVLGNEHRFKKRNL